ncbi:hypothetical protein [Bacillus sp. ISTL8]|uniref:hypothetical protein n=1 Tax=Bacillus sp. ISTL8 TaxID=2596896 RepID=UPI0014565405|nr:hypothetical protein [Bacillus sp. ISTL8]
MKQVINAENIVFFMKPSDVIGSNATYIESATTGVEPVRENKLPDIDADFMNMSVSEVILKYIKQKYCKDFTWEQIVLATYGEAVLIAPLYWTAIEYLKEHK